MSKPPSSPRAADRWDWGTLASIALHEAGRVLTNRHDCEDAAQEAMIRAYRARLGCLTPEAPGGWVRTIARREALRILAARPPTVAAVTESLDHADADEGERAGAADELSDAVLDRVAAQSLLVQIPLAERSLLVRRYLLEHSSFEIAADLQLPASTVRVRLHRALERFREHHQPDG